MFSTDPNPWYLWIVAEGVEYQWTRLWNPCDYAVYTADLKWGRLTNGVVGIVGPVRCLERGLGEFREVVE